MYGYALRRGRGVKNVENWGPTKMFTLRDFYIEGFHCKWKIHLQIHFVHPTTKTVPNHSQNLWSKNVYFAKSYTHRNMKFYIGSGQTALTVSNFVAIFWFKKSCEMKSSEHFRKSLLALVIITQKNPAHFHEFCCPNLRQPT